MPKIRHKVYCQGCVHLLLIKRNKVLPLCLAKAKFRGGILRSRVDVIGVTQAEIRNVRNNCRCKSRNILELFFNREMKSWIRRDLNAEEATLKDYPRQEEIANKIIKSVESRNKKEQASRSNSFDKKDSDGDSVRDFDTDNIDKVSSGVTPSRNECDEKQGEGDRFQQSDSGHDKRGGSSEGGGEWPRDGESASDLSGEDGGNPETSGSDKKLEEEDNDDTDAAEESDSEKETSEEDIYAEIEVPEACHFCEYFNLRVDGMVCVHPKRPAPLVLTNNVDTSIAEDCPIVT